ncbi:MAG TPA: hypothetical protein H9675_05245 [Firmicutes bacterium]|nr:hypothetical protein [Bacillota bacterium]
MLKKIKMLKPIKLKNVKIGTAKYFCSSFISALSLALCPFALILGIIISDYNTRSTGLSDAKPVIYLENDDGVEFHVLGYTLSISSDTSDKITQAGEAALSFIAPQLRIICAVPSAINSLICSICEFFTQLS